MADRQKSLEGALNRFRFMAIWGGVMSLLLWCVDVPVTLSGSSLHTKLAWIGIVHGFTYPIYVLAAFHYCLVARKSFFQTIFFILAGTLPFASFVAERRAISEFRTQIARSSDNK